MPPRGRRRLRRRSFSPNRPALFPEQYGLAMVTAFVILGSIAVVIWALAQ
jgi:hypothetical protein